MQTPIRVHPFADDLFEAGQWSDVQCTREPQCLCLHPYLVAYDLWDPEHISPPVPQFPLL